MTTPIHHLTIPLHTGFKPHVLHVPAGITRKGCVILIHGFPDTNWGWRHLLKPIAAFGFDVYAPSMRGYGPTDAKLLSKDEDLCLENICQDVEALLDALQVDKAVIVGHDWGGTVAWNFSIHYSHRTLAVASFCTPFYAVPTSNPWEKMKKNPGRFMYQMVFQTEKGVEILESNFERTVNVMMRASDDEPISDADVEWQSQMFGIDKINGEGSSLINLKTTSPSKMLTDADRKIYVQQFKECGFLNPLRWYRNVERNWKYNTKIAGKRVTCPALMVTAEHDHILPPSMTYGMEKHIDLLQVVHIKNSTHWILQQQPERSAQVLCNWLLQVFPSKSQL